MISFDMGTATNVISDDEIAIIQQSARSAADRGLPMPPFTILKGTTIVQRMLAALRHVVWCDAYDHHKVAQIKKAVK
jgi:hypothetical protein